MAYVLSSYESNRLEAFKQNISILGTCIDVCVCVCVRVCVFVVLTCSCVAAGVSMNVWDNPAVLQRATDIFYRDWDSTYAVVQVPGHECAPTVSRPGLKHTMPAYSH